MNQIYACREGKEVPFTDAKISSTATPATGSRIRSVFSKLLLGVFLFLVVGAQKSMAQGTVTFSTAGTFSYVVPPGVTSMTFDVTGAGGGGAGADPVATVVGGGGGGGGSFERYLNLAVTPGQVLTITVGAGGIAGPIATAGGQGGITTVSVGGISHAGAAGGAIPSGAIGGSGHTQTGGDGGSGMAAGVGIQRAGGGGGGAGTLFTNGITGNDGAGGGAGGVTGGGNATAGTGGSATANGGGGAGGTGYTTPLAFPGGAGGAGMVVITWTCPTYSIPAIPAQCLSGAAVDLDALVGLQPAWIATGNIPPGSFASFSGPGVTGTPGSSNYSFSPAAAGVGCHTITYSYVPTDGCPNTATTDVLVYPVAPSIAAINPVCQGTAFTLPTVAAVAGFTVQWSINGGAFTAAPVIPTTPGCHTVQARYVNTAACGAIPAGTQGPGACGLSNTRSVTTFPTNPTLTQPASSCNAMFTLPAVTPVAGFNVEYRINGGAWSAAPTISTPGCHTVEARYVAAVGCGITVAGDAGPAGCNGSAPVNALIYPTAPVLVAQPPVCEPGPLTLPPVAPVAGFTTQYSINGAAFSAAPVLPVVPGTFTIAARYVNTAACGTVAALTGGPGACATSALVNGHINTVPQVNDPANVGPVCCNAGNIVVPFTISNAPALPAGGTLVYNWTNSNPAIGLPAAGSGPINFTPACTIPGQTATITVTASYTFNGVTCTGTSQSFTITVFPSVDGTIIAGTTSICAGQAGSVNIDLTGVPNFGGTFSISVFNGVGVATGNFPWVATVNGPSAVSIPAANLTNTSNGTTTYRVSWQNPTTALVDANGCSPVNPLTGVHDIVVYPVPNITATLVNAPGDICPGTPVVFNVANPNLVLNSLFNWTAVGANAVTYGSGTNVAFGNGAVSLSPFSCPVPAGANPITFTFTPVGPGPLGCVGTPVTAQVNVRDLVPPVLTNGGAANLTPTIECSDAAAITAARNYVPTFTNSNCSGAPVVTVTTAETFTPTCGYAAPYSVGETGTLVTTWLATEPCGATTSVTQTITLVDTQIPTWTTANGTLNTTIQCTNDAAAFAAQLAAAQAFVPIPTDACTPLGTLTANRVKVAGTFAQSNPGTCVTAGTYTNTFTTTDACGNASIIYTQIITIVDNTSPTLGDPGPQTLNVGAGANCQVPLPDYRGLVTYTDCTPILSSVQSPLPGTTIVGGPGPGPVGGSQIVTITVTDGCGNVSVRNITVNLTDATPPIARCHDMTVTLNGSGAGTLNVSQLDGNKNGVAGNGTTTPVGNPWILSSDNCGLGTVFFNPANTGLSQPFPAANGNTTTVRNFNCSHLTNLVGTIPLTLRVTDPSGNSTDCISNITVLDVTPPVITCVAPVTLQKNATCVTILPSFVGVGQTTATDACGPITITQIPAAGSIIAADVASLSVQFIAVDGSGNSSTCSTVMQFRDQTPPVITGAVCGSTITVTTGVGNTDCQVFVNWTPPTATDNCSPILGTTTLTSTHLPSGPATTTFSGSGIITIPGSGNGTPFPATINVTGIPLGATVQSITLNGVTHTFPGDIDAAVVSPLNTPVVIMADVNPTFAGATGETYTFRDGFPLMNVAGFNPTGTYSPTSGDATADVFTPGPGSLNQAAPTLASFGNGNHNGIWSLYVRDDVGGDAGQINNWSITFSTFTAGTPFFVGTTPVTYTATDAAGNTSTCTFNVVVIDNTLPTIACTTPGDKTVNANTGGCTYTHAGAAWDATGTDNCIPITSIFYRLTGATGGAFPGIVGTNGQSLNGRVFNQGTTTVTWTIVDQYTNSTTCSFNVIVTDTQGPTLTCPANITLNANAAGCRGTVPGSSMIPVASDNCGITLVEWSVSGATPASSGLGNIGTFTFNIGTSLVTYRVHDAAGNSTLCTFNVTVNNAVAGAISGTSTVAQNIATTSTITFTGSGAPAGANYTFTYNVNGGATQTVSTTGGSNIVTVAQSNAIIGTFTYTLLTVTDNITGCPGAITPPNTAVVTVVNGTPDLTASQLFTTTQVAAGGAIDEVVVIRNVGTTATSAPIVFTVSTYSALTGLTVSSNGAASVTIGFTTYTLGNANWTFNAGTGTFTSNAGVFIPAGGTVNIGIRIVRGTSPNQGANGTVNQTITITNGTGGGETPTNNNTINNSLLKN